MKISQRQEVEVYEERKKKIKYGEEEPYTEIDIPMPKIDERIRDKVLIELKREHELAEGKSGQ